jgi:Ca2+-binding EF-hand superfamily protein
MDDNKNKKLDFEEFKKGITEYGLNYSKEEIKEIFNVFDKDKSGQIDFEEFLERLRVGTIFTIFIIKKALFSKMRRFFILI